MNNTEQIAKEVNDLNQQNISLLEKLQTYSQHQSIADLYLKLYDDAHHDNGQLTTQQKEYIEECQNNNSGLTSNNHKNSTNNSNVNANLLRQFNNRDLLANISIPEPAPLSQNAQQQQQQQQLQQFDPSIAKFFDSHRLKLRKVQTRTRTRNGKRQTQSIVESQKKIILAKLKEQQLVNNIVLENLFRIGGGGITAFSVNDPEAKSHSGDKGENRAMVFEENGVEVIDIEMDNDNDNSSTATNINNNNSKIKKSNSNNSNENYMLGIRFDNYNHHTNSFESPHYIILKKNLKNGNLMIFKHTVPQYINLADLEHRYLNSDIFQFVKQVQNRISLSLKKVIEFEKLVDRFGSLDASTTTVTNTNNDNHSNNDRNNGDVKKVELIDCNLSYTRVVLQLTSKTKKPTQANSNANSGPLQVANEFKIKIQLMLNFTNLTNVTVLDYTGKLSGVKKLQIEHLLRGDYTGLVGKLEKVFKLLDEADFNDNNIVTDK